MTPRPAQCPVCHNKVSPTAHGNICGHLDKAKHPCPASYNLSFDKAIFDHTAGKAHK